MDNLSTGLETSPFSIKLGMGGSPNRQENARRIRRLQAMLGLTVKGVITVIVPP